MKINMWKLLFAALIASTAMVACKDERNNYMVDDTISFLATDNQLINVALYNEECDLTVIKSGKGQTGWRFRKLRSKRTIRPTARTTRPCRQTT